MEYRILPIQKNIVIEPAWPWLCWNRYWNKWMNAFSAACNASQSVSMLLNKTFLCPTSFYKLHFAKREHKNSVLVSTTVCTLSWHVCMWTVVEGKIDYQGRGDKNSHCTALKSNVSQDSVPMHCVNYDFCCHSFCSCLPSSAGEEHE